MAKLNHVTVKELIELLGQFPPDMEVLRWAGSDGRSNVCIDEVRLGRTHHGPKKFVVIR